MRVKYDLRVSLIKFEGKKNKSANLIKFEGKFKYMPYKILLLNKNKVLAKKSQLFFFKACSFFKRVYRSKQLILAYWI